MKQPGIMKIGDQFFIKVEAIAIKLPHLIKLKQAFGYLIMYYYALSVSYPTDLISVFVFFELIFGLTPSYASKIAQTTFGRVQL